MHWEPISNEDQSIIARQLQREPRNLCGVARRCSQQCPQVIVNNPLPTAEQDAYFFPTLFWLTCPEAVRRISRLEDRGFIQQVQTKLNEYQQVRQNMRDAHLEYIMIRRQLLGRERLLALKTNAKSLSHQLESQGIGGSENMLGIKCLHMHYAHFLATHNNPVGLLISKALDFSDEPWRCQDCRMTSESESLVTAATLLKKDGHEKTIAQCV